MHCSIARPPCPLIASLRTNLQNQELRRGRIGIWNRKLGAAALEAQHALRPLRRAQLAARPAPRPFPGCAATGGRGVGASRQRCGYRACTWGELFRPTAELILALRGEIIIQNVGTRMQKPTVCARFRVRPGRHSLYANCEREHARCVPRGRGQCSDVAHISHSSTAGAPPAAEGLTVVVRWCMERLGRTAVVLTDYLYESPDGAALNLAKGAKYESMMEFLLS